MYQTQNIVQIIIFLIDQKIEQFRVLKQNLEFTLRFQYYAMHYVLCLIEFNILILLACFACAC